MGLFSRSPPPPPRVYGALELFSPPLGRDRSFCVSRETVLTIKERSFSKDFDITDADGNVVILCEGKAVSFSSKRKLTHPQTGEKILKLETQLFSLSQWGVNPEGLNVLEIITQGGIANTILSIYFDNVADDSAPVELILQADDEKDNRAQVTHKNRSVAWITHESKWLTSTPYMMTVAPGVDLALMAAICLSYDNILHNRRGASNAGTEGGIAEPNQY